MADLIPAELVTPGINDERSRAFAATLSAVLGEFQTAALLIQDPLTVDAKLLPIMTIELGMTEFMTPGLLETHVRQLLVHAPNIHAMTGTVAGVRRALGGAGRDGGLAAMVAKAAARSSRYPRGRGLHQ